MSFTQPFFLRFSWQPRARITRCIHARGNLTITLTTKGMNTGGQCRDSFYAAFHVGNPGSNPVWEAKIFSAVLRFASVA